MNLSIKAKTLALLSVIPLTASCASSSLLPHAHPSTNSPSSDWSTIWTENASKRVTRVTAVDGQTIRARPHAVTLPPGMHVISVHTIDLIDAPHLLPTPYAKFDVTINAQPRHSYVIRHKVAADGETTTPYIEELGENTYCEYVTGQRSLPIYLRCTES